MRTLLFSLVLIGCGGSSNTTPPVDAPPPDTANVALDCPTYCAEITANCTGANLQYPDMAHCIGSCAAFTVTGSKVTDSTGDTLGCRIYHAGDPAKMDPALHCPHAGPGGDKLNIGAAAGFCSGGDVCTNFCALQIFTCGSTDSPKTIAGVQITPQYKNQTACVAVCKNGDQTVTPAIPAFDVTHLYATTSSGNSLACRLNHWTNAASLAAAATPNTTMINAHCSHTAAAQVTTSGLPCASATPMP